MSHALTSADLAGTAYSGHVNEDHPVQTGTQFWRGGITRQNGKLVRRCADVQLIEDRQGRWALVNFFVGDTLTVSSEYAADEYAAQLRTDGFWPIASSTPLA